MPTLVRPALISDASNLQDICLKTGDAGRDATALFQDSRLLGDIFAVPYLRFEPDFAFVAEDEQGVAGYILGTPDTAAFRARLEAEWWPELRRRHPLPPPEPEGTFDLERHFIRAFVHAPAGPLEPCLQDHPAHLHIDLLPRLQGQGLGRRLMDTLLQKFRTRGVKGVHWGVDGRNQAALAFYGRLGARILERPDWGVWFGMDL